MFPYPSVHTLVGDRRIMASVIHAGDGDDVIVLEGTVAAVTDGAELRKVDAMRGDKHVDPASGARDTILVKGTVLYRVAIEHIMAWMYGNMVVRTDWWLDGQELSSESP